MAKLIARTYSDALFETAVEEDLVDGLFEETGALKTILKDNPELVRLMNHPKLTKEEKQELFDNIFRESMSRELMGFIRVIITNGRFSEIDSILEQFTDTVKEYKGIGTAYVTTPVPLSDSQKKAVREKLLATAGYKSMEMNYAVDETLLGGMVIRIGDRVVDSSIKSKLEALKKSLLNVQIG